MAPLSDEPPKHRKSVVDEISQGKVSLSFVSGSATEREEQRLKFQRQAAVIRGQLKSMERCVVSPQGKFIQRWDKVTATALIFTAFVTPWEVGLLPSGFWEPTYLSYPLFSINRVVDSIFLCDICIQFFLPYRSRDGLWIFKHSQMAVHYCRTWFPLDAISSIPYDSIFLVAQSMMPSADEGAGGGGLRMLKMLRLLKLGRILRASRILKRWEAFIGLSHASLQLKMVVIREGRRPPPQEVPFNHA